MQDHSHIYVYHRFNLVVGQSIIARKFLIVTYSIKCSISISQLSSTQYYRTYISYERSRTVLTLFLVCLVSRSGLSVVCVFFTRGSYTYDTNLQWTLSRAWASFFFSPTRQLSIAIDARRVRFICIKNMKMTLHGLLWNPCVFCFLSYIKALLLTLIA